MQRREVLSVQHIDRTVRRYVEHQVGVGHGFVDAGHMEERLVRDRFGVSVARAVADIGHPSLDGASDLSFVTLNSSSAEICRAGIGIVWVGNERRVRRNCSAEDSGRYPRFRVTYRSSLRRRGELPK